MADGKIYITISDERGKETPNTPSPSPIPSPVEPESKPRKSEKEEKNDFLKHQFFNFVESNAKKFASYSIQNIGNFTGDYNMQRNINSTLQLVNSVKSIAVASASYGVAGFAFSTATSIINAGMSEISNATGILKQNQEIERLRKISGLNSLYDGSRGTQS